MAETNNKDNPIYTWLVDFPSVVAVSRNIEALDDPRVQSCKTEFFAAFEKVKRNYSASSTEPLSPLDCKHLPTEELSAFSLEVFFEICQLVTSAMACYRTVSTFRSLTMEERKQGEILRELLISMQQLIPSSTAQADLHVPEQESRAVAGS